MLTVKPASDVPSRREYVLRMKEYAGINLNDSQYTMPIEESPDAKNVSFKGGDLKRINGFGAVKWSISGTTVSLAQLPETVTKLFEFQSDDISADYQGYKNLYYSDTRGGLYRFIYNTATNKIEADILIPTGTDEGKPITYFTQFKNGTDNCAVLGGSECGPYVYTEGGTYSLISTVTRPHITNAVMHYGRLFGVGDPTYPQRIWFSKLNNPADFESSATGGGYIDIGDYIGNTVDVVSHFETLYVFCRYGIVALDTLSAQSEFTLENVYYSEGEIIPGSITAYGSRIFFATRYGVFSFNGSSVKCISNKISGFFGNGKVKVQNEASLCYKSKYMLSFHKTDSSKGIILYDIFSGRWEIFEGGNIKSMAVLRDSAGDKLLCAFATSSIVMEYGIGVYYATSGIIQCQWTSPFNDWGEAYVKKEIREIHFSGSGNGSISLTVNADGSTQTRTVALSNDEKIYRLPFDIAGNNISITIANVSGANFTVTPLTVIYTKERQNAVL